MNKEEEEEEEEEAKETMPRQLLQAPWSPDRKSRELAFQAMHANATKTDPCLMGKIRKSIKKYYTEQNIDVSIATWTLVNCSIRHTPQSPLINVVLHELFPVLQGALCSCDALRLTSCVPPGSSLPHLNVPFDTVLHGPVMLSCVGADKRCRMEVIKTKVEEEEQGYCLRVYPDVIIMGISHCGVCVSVIHQRSYCRACYKEDTRDAKLLRCSRCWEKLSAPVWYCSAQCQTADYPRHKKECGKVFSSDMHNS